MSDTTNINWQSAAQYDGTREGLTKHEFGNYVRAEVNPDISQHDIDQFFNIVDTNNDGKIYRREMNSYSATNNAATPATPTSRNSESQLDKMSWDGRDGVDGAKLTRYDGQRAGLIEGEFKRYVREGLGVDLNDQELENLFELLDLNGDKRLKKNEITGRTGGNDKNAGIYEVTHGSNVTVHQPRGGNGDVLRGEMQTFVIYSDKKIEKIRGESVDPMLKTSPTSEHVPEAKRDNHLTFYFDDEGGHPNRVKPGGVDHRLKSAASFDLDYGADNQIFGFMRGDNIPNFTANGAYLEIAFV